MRSAPRPPARSAPLREVRRHLVARQDVRRAERAAGIVLCRRSGGEDDRGNAAANLQGGAADPAGARVDHHHLALLERAESGDVQPRGEKRLRDRGGLLEREPGRDGDCLRRRHARLLGVPPPASSAITRSPRFQAPAACSTSPAISSPRVSGSPGGGGYRPSRCRRSARFTPAARTRTTRSPSRGCGSGTSDTCKTSGPPGCFTTMARIRVSIYEGLAACLHSASSMTASVS